MTPFSLVGGPRFTMTGDCDHRARAYLLTLKRRIWRSIYDTKGRVQAAPSPSMSAPTPMRFITRNML